MTSRIVLTSLERADDPLVADARRLLLEYAESLDVDLAFQGFGREIAEFPVRYLPPSGALILAHVDGDLAGSVAMRRLEGEICEMKRLYVRPAFRGCGAGKRLAVAIIDAARELGYGHMRLDTLPSMDDAQRLYRALGFNEIAAYYENPVPGTRYLELDLRLSR